VSQCVSPGASALTVVTVMRLDTAFPVKISTAPVAGLATN